MSNIIFVGNYGIYMAQLNNSYKYYYIKDDDNSNIKQYVENFTDKAVGEFNRDDIYIWDYHYNNHSSDEFRMSGYKVIYGSQASRLVEEKRVIQYNIFRKLGIRTPETYFAKSISDAIAIIEKLNYEDFVVKLAGNVPNWTTQIFHSKEDAIYALKPLIGGLEEGYPQKQNEDSNVQEICIQKYVRGIEISCEVWFGQNGVVVPYTNYTIEAKKFLAGDLGLTTGCEMCLTWFGDRYAPFANDVVRLGRYLSNSGLIGSVDVNFIVESKDSYYALEITPRMGYDAHPGLFYLIENTVGLRNFMNSLYDNNICYVPKNIYCFTLRLTAPPYPIEELYSKYKYGGSVIFPFDDRVKIYKLSVDVNDIIQYPEVAVLTAHNANPEDAIDVVYSVAENIRYSGKQYRVDAKDVLLTRLEEIGGMYEII